jgi:phenol/toluene 2-monooxygenase (NADH) P0/A0
MHKPVLPLVDKSDCKTTQKFVRVKEVRSSGLVCFEFAIGWPELFVELILPKSAFDDFCARQQVQLLSD